MNAKPVVTCCLAWLGIVALALPARASVRQDSDAPGAPAADGAAAAPDIVLILIDTLRVDHLGFRGYERETAPFLADLARQSVVFPRAYSSSSWTAPSTASVFTGLYPTRHGVQEGLWVHLKEKRELEKAGEATIQVTSIPESLATLPQRLRAAGYQTFGAAANLNIGKRIGFHRGFDHFRRKRADAAELAQTVRGWRAAMASERPYFLYMHLNDAHLPYKGHPRWYERQKDEVADEIARYDSEISFLDEQLAGLYEEMGWKTEAIVIVVSDHGEEFADRGPDRFGHPFSLHSELNDVLMIVHDPAVAPRASEVPVNVSLVDVLPTVLELAGAPVPVDLDGSSLVSLVRSRAESPRRVELEQRVLFAHRTDQTSPAVLWAIVDGRWKLIENEHDRSRKLYDLHADRREQKDVAGEHPQLVEALGRRLEQFRRGSLPVGGIPDETDVQVDEAMLEHLEALGYVGGEDD